MTPNAYAAPTDACQFVDGFAYLRSLLPIVGECVDNESWIDGQRSEMQYSTGGLLIWEKDRNITYFTNGYQTWLLGPKGLEERPNSMRFRWEIDGSQVSGGEDLVTFVANPPPAIYSLPTPMPTGPPRGIPTPVVVSPAPVGTSTVLATPPPPPVEGQGSVDYLVLVEFPWFVGLIFWILDIVVKKLGALDTKAVASDMGLLSLGVNVSEAFQDAQDHVARDHGYALHVSILLLLVTFLFYVGAVVVEKATDARGAAPAANRWIGLWTSRRGAAILGALAYAPQALVLLWLNQPLGGW